MSDTELIFCTGGSHTVVLVDPFLAFDDRTLVERGLLIGLVSIGDVVKMRIAEAEMEAAAMRQYIATG